MASESRRKAMYQKFGERYDEIYSGRDYAADCDMVERILAEFSVRAPCRLIDLGCGTGEHALRLAQSGYDVVGVDRSATMIRAATRKATKEGRGKAEFHVADMRKLQFNAEFEACISLFSSLGYLTAASDLQRALRCVARCLKPRGIFVVEFWDEKAVKAHPPAARRKVVSLPNGRVLVVTGEAKLSTARNHCSIHYAVNLFEGRNLVDSFEEVHAIRFFQSQELAQEMRQAGLRVLDFRAPAAVRRDNWFLVGIACADRRG